MQDEAEPIFINLKEATRLTGISRSELYRRLAKGEIEARKLGSSLLIDLASLRTFVAGLPRAEFTPPPRKP